MWLIFYPSPSFSCLPSSHRGWAGAPDDWTAVTASQLPFADSAHCGGFLIANHHSWGFFLFLFVWSWLPLQGRLSWALWPNKGRIRPLRLWLLFAYPVLLEVLEETGQSYLKKIFLRFFLMWTIFKVYWICYNIDFVLCFGFPAARYVGSELPDLELNPPHPRCIGKWGLNHWTAREVPAQMGWAEENERPEKGKKCTCLRNT